MQDILVQELSFFFFNRICNCVCVHHLSPIVSWPYWLCSFLYCRLSVFCSFQLLMYKGFISCAFIILVIQKTAPKCLWQCRGICYECAKLLWCVILEEGIFLHCLVSHSGLSVTATEHWTQQCESGLCYDWGLQFQQGTNTAAKPWACIHR